MEEGTFNSGFKLLLHRVLKKTKQNKTKKYWGQEGAEREAEVGELVSAVSITLFLH